MKTYYWNSIKKLYKHCTVNFSLKNSLSLVLKKAHQRTSWASTDRDRCLVLKLFQSPAPTFLPCCRQCCIFLESIGLNPRRRFSLHWQGRRCASNHRRTAGCTFRSNIYTRPLRFAVFSRFSSLCIALLMPRALGFAHFWQPKSIWYWQPMSYCCYHIGHTYYRLTYKFAKRIPLSHFCFWISAARGVLVRVSLLEFW